MSEVKETTAREPDRIDYFMFGFRLGVVRTVIFALGLCLMAHYMNSRPVEFIVAPLALFAILYGLLVGDDSMPSAFFVPWYAGICISSLLIALIAYAILGPGIALASSGACVTFVAGCVVRKRITH